MPESLCTAPSCPQPVTDAFLCTACSDRAVRYLRELAGHPSRRGLLAPPLGAEDSSHDRGLLADLMVTLTRQAVLDPDTARPAEVDDDPPRHWSDQPIASHPLPLHLGASAALASVSRDLRRWVAALVEDRFGADLDGLAADVAYRRQVSRPRTTGQWGPVCGPWRPGPLLPDGDDPRELAAWLGRHTDTLRQHTRAGEIAAGITRHRNLAERVVAPSPMVYLGCCEHCRSRTDGTEAEVELYAERTASALRCPRCGQTWDVRERRQWLLERAADQWLSAADLDRALVDWVRDVRASLELAPRRFTAAAVRSMADRGRLARRDPTRAELAAGTVTAPRFNVGDAMALVVTLAGEDRDRRSARLTRSKGAA